MKKRLDMAMDKDTVSLRHAQLCLDKCTLPVITSLACVILCMLMSIAISRAEATKMAAFSNSLLAC